ncbi:MAG: endonuclease/exonuclease/phosphatase family protein [Gammaproteobacteria bacterium]|nr:endonuclease/exonuclease/phosphatase family protein [Gammaproteobacteria bacterium]
MPVFPKPKFAFDYNPMVEIEHLRQHRQKRSIPNRENDTLLVATWNIANFGAQERTDKDLSLLAEIVSWFDLVAIQECRGNFGDLFDVQRKLPSSYRVVMSDVAGNDERMVYVYDSEKLTVLEEVGEIAFPPSQCKSVKLPGITQTFDGFDRNPYLASFATGKTSFTFVNVHLYFGDGKPKSIARRSLETFAVAKWADLRKKSRFSFTREVVALGDFNMPKREPGDPIFNALTKLGLEVPEHSTRIASSISTDAEYDQIVFLPETSKRCFTGQKGVFDYDSVLFPELWQDGKNKNNFKTYLRYHISDHRPMWAQLWTNKG